MRGVYLRVGLLAVAAVVLVTGAVLFLSGNQIRHAQGYETYFRDSVQGLDVGTPVKYRGVAIGAVTQIGLTSAEYGRGQPEAIRLSTLRTVLVRFEVDTTRVGQPPNAAAVAQGLRARIAPQGLTGQSYVELDFFDAARYPPLAVPWTPRYEYVPSVPSTLSQVQDSATVLLAKLQQVDFVGLAEGAQGLIHELRGTLRDGDVPAMLAQAHGTLRALQTALTDADVPELAAELRQTLTAARTLAQGPQTRDLMRAATAAADRLTQATARLPQLLASLDAVARRADTGSADLEAGLVPILRDARTAAATLREASESLRRDPGQVVFGGPPPRSRDR